ncbi:iron ABC transporter permease [Anaerolineales bacterium]
MILFFFYPLLSILILSFRPEGTWDFSGFIKLLSSPYYRDTFFYTCFQAFLSTFFTILLALPAAAVFVRFRFRGKNLLLSLATLPFVLPTVVVATAFTALIGKNGVLNQFLMQTFSLEQAPIQIERSLLLIIIVHVFYNYAIALRMISSYWARISSEIDEAALILGCKGWRLWWYIRLPLLRPIIFAASILVFIFTFTSFGIVLILGGIRFATLEVQIYNQAVNMLNLPLAAALSLIQISIMFILMLFYTKLQKQSQTTLRAENINQRNPRTKWEKIQVSGTVILISLFLFSPIVALLWRSVTAGMDGISFQHYINLFINDSNSVLFVPPIQAILNSLFFAILAMILALLLGSIGAYMIHLLPSALLDPLFMLPLATSAVTLGFGFIIALGTPPLNLRSSWLIVVIAHTLVAIPFVVRSVLPAIRQIPHSVLEAGTVLGAAPLSRWRLIDLPLLGRSLLVGAIFAFTISMGEFGASLFVARPDTPTIPLVIYRLLGRPGQTNYGQALAMSVILMLICMLGFILIERLRNVGVGEF